MATKAPRVSSGFLRQRSAAAVLGAAAALLMAAAAQAACLKAQTDNQVAEGKLTSVQISIPDYQFKEQAYILQLKSDACLEGTDEFDKVDHANRIHVFSLDDAMRKKLRAAVGKIVRVSGNAFGEENIHHHAPIVMGVTSIETLPGK
jgi:predicted nucleic acid-binding OB-fold protein